MIPLRLIGAHWRKGFLRTSLSTLAITLAVFLFCMLRTTLTTLDSMVTSVSGNRLITSNAVSLFAFLRISMQPKLEAMAGVRRVGQWTWFGGTYVDPKNFFPRFATDVPSFRDIYGDRAPDGPIYKMSPAEWQAFARERKACIVGAGLASKYGFGLGDAITLKGDLFPVDLTFTVRGIYETGNPTYDDLTLFFHWRYLDETTGKTGRVSTFTLDLEDSADGGAVAHEVDEYFRSSATPTVTQSELAFQAQFLTMWGNVPLLFNAIGTVALFASFLITLNTMLLNGRERVVEIGVLKTLGFPDHAALWLYVIEGLSMALIGGGLGIGAARLLAHGEALDLQMVYLPVFVLTSGTAGAALGLSALVGLIAGLAPGLVALRLPIVQALRRLG